MRTRPSANDVQSEQQHAALPQSARPTDRLQAGFEDLRPAAAQLKALAAAANTSPRNQSLLAMQAQVDASPRARGASPPSAAGAVVQRAVGFEFQTVGNNNPKLYTSAIASEQTAYGTHGTIIEDRKEQGFKVTADKKDLEIVTYPVNETTEGMEQLTKQMAAVKACMHDLIQAYQKNDSKPIRIGTEALGIYLDVVAETPTAHPQSTMGVKLESIPSLFKELLNDENKEWAFSALAPREVSHKKHLTAMLERHANNETMQSWAQAYPKFHGFMTLLGSYVATQIGTQADFPSPQAKIQNWTKDGVTAMSRSNLADVALRIEDGAKPVFSSLANNNEQMRTHLGLSMEQYLGPLTHPKYHHDNAESSANTDPLTVRTFITSLVPASSTKPGVDAFADAGTEGMSKIDQEYLHEANLAENIGPFAAPMTSSTDIGPSDAEETRTGAIVELRDLKRGIPYTEWGAVAVAAMTMLARINASK